MPISTGYTTGTPVSGRQTTTNRLNLAGAKRRQPFLLFANEASWQFEGGEWLPIVKICEARPGVNGATTDRSGSSVETAGMVAHMLQRGFVHLKAGDPRLGVEFETPERGGVGLMSRVDMADGGCTFAPPWEGYGHVAGQTRKAVDDELYLTFRRRVSDLLGGMSREVLEDNLRRLDARIANRQADRSGGIGNQRQLELLTKQREAWIEAWEIQYGPKAHAAPPAAAAAEKKNKGGD